MSIHYRAMQHLDRATALLDREGDEHLIYAALEMRFCIELVSDLRPTLRTISLRLPESMIGRLKVLANKRDVPYQSLLKQFLAERLERELSRGA